MSEADKMFEELGYTNIEREDNCIEYDDDCCIIIFNKESKTVSKGSYLEYMDDITLFELRAINAKVKELGWI